MIQASWGEMGLRDQVIKLCAEEIKQGKNPSISLFGYHKEKGNTLLGRNKHVDLYRQINIGCLCNVTVGAYQSNVKYVMLCDPGECDHKLMHSNAEELELNICIQSDIETKQFLLLNKKTS